MKRDEFKNVKISTLVSLIVHGGNNFGFKLAEILSAQGSNVIVIDYYSKNKKDVIKKLKTLKNVEFIDFHGLEDLFATLKRFDYVFYLQNEFLASAKEFKSRDFLTESNNLNLVLKSASKYNAKFSLISSVQLNKSLTQAVTASGSGTPSPYSAEEIQKYAETVTAEFHDKSSLDARIIRTGSILGEFIVDSDSLLDDHLTQLLNNSVKNNEINIIGEGLDTHYLIHIEDALYGILKLTFNNKTNGEVTTLANNREYTTLSIAYKLLELNPTASTIKFLPPSDKMPLLVEQYSPAPNAEEYGWQQKYPLEQTLTEELEQRYSAFNKNWKDKPDIQTETIQDNIQNQPKDGAPTEKNEESAKSAKKVETLDKPISEEKISLMRRNNERVTPTKVRTTSVSEKTAFGNFLDNLVSPLRKLGAKTQNKVNDTKKSFKDPKQLAKLAAGITLSFLLVYFLIGPIITMSIGGFLVYNETKQAYSNINSLQFEEAEPHFENLIKYFNRTEKSMLRLSWAFDVVGQDDLFNNLKQTAYGVRYGAEGTKDLISSLEPLAEYARNFEPAISISDTTPTNYTEYREELQQLRDNRGKIANATYKISLASEIIDGIDTNAFPEKSQSYIADIKTQNEEIGALLEPFQKTVSFLPELLGIDGRQRYLILLQNPSEIRSTGGWLSSFALIGIENGQIRQLEVDDIYNIEGQLKNQGVTFDAPDDMQEALGIEQWSFSLVNWDPNLSNVSKEAEAFLIASGKISDIDGVITFDVTMIQKLLEKWGGVEVPGETETITADNLYDKIFEIHMDFTPGSTQKTTFLANLSNVVLSKIFSSDSTGYADLSQVLIESLNEKHVQIYIEDVDAAQFITEQGWDGDISANDSGAPISIEWNWGANKSNLYLERNTDLRIDIQDENTLRYKYKVSLKNVSTSKTYPQGDYVDYQRIYLPEYATVSSAIGFKDNVYDIYLEDGYKVIAGWFEVPIQTTKQLEINYVLERPTATISNGYFPIDTQDNSLLMTLNLFKQPGLDSDSYSIDVIYPDKWAVVDQQDFNKGVNILQKSFDHKTDSSVRLVWEFK